MELYIVRHGETECNRGHVVQGFTVPSYLNEKGRSQARCTGKKLKNIKFSHIYSSDLERAKETCRIISEELDFQPDVSFHSELRERNYGEFEGHSWEEIKKIFGTDTARSITEAPPGGESLWDVKKRLDDFISFLKKTHRDNENILVITHNGTVIMLFLCLLELSFSNHKNFLFDNGSVSRFHIGDKFNRLVFANDTSHLYV